MYARLTGTGSYLPGSPVSNADLAGRGIDTNDEWIVSRTGIRTRHFAAENEYTSHLCVGAAKSLVEENNVTIDDVDFIIVATVTPDQTIPAYLLKYRTNWALPTPAPSTSRRPAPVLPTASYWRKA